MDAPKILLTGPPRCGKSTLIEKIAARLESPPAGFFTREIRESGRRAGLAIVTFSGGQGVLAHRDIPGRPRVGKYGVNLADLDGIAVPAMTPSDPEQVVIIDEIGKMECFSALFRRRLGEVLAGENPLLASIALRGNRFIEELKRRACVDAWRRADVRLVHVSEGNRNELESLAEFFR